MKQTIKRNTPEEEAAIQHGIAADPDARELTDEEWSNARPAAEALPASIYTELTTPHRRSRGAKSPNASVTFQLDQDVLDGLQATGPGWQIRANEALRKLVKG